MAIKPRILKQSNGRVVLGLRGETWITLGQLQRLQKMHLTGRVVISAEVVGGCMSTLQISGKLRKKSTLRV